MKLDDLYKKYPFIYELNGTYYYLGWGICKICESNMALYYYKKYKNCIKSMRSEVIVCNKNIDDEQLDQLLYYFRKVKAYSDIATDERDMPNFKKEMFKFISQLDEGERSELYNQLTDFVNTFHHYYMRYEK